MMKWSDEEGKEWRWFKRSFRSFIIISVACAGRPAVHPPDICSTYFYYYCAVDDIAGRVCCLLKAPCGCARQSLLHENSIGRLDLT